MVPVGLHASTPRRLPASAAPVVLCVLAIALSFAFVRNGSGDDDGALLNDSGANMPASAGGAAEEGDEGDGERLAIGELAGQFAQDDEVVREVLNAEASPSSPDAFLDDLSGAGEPVETVGWTDAVGLEHAGRGVLGAYERAGASLQMHGFLDLHGTAWAAVLQGGEWVDVVSVVGSHGGPASVRVARIKAE